MDTEALRLFVYAAEMLNISGAGRRLGMAPAVASARLAKLENQIGADLLHRSTRKVSLSREGAEVLPYAREILAQEDAARAALGHGTKEATGTLRFAAPSSFAQLFIAPILPEFLERHPKVNLELRFSDAQTNIIEGGIDLALRNLAVADSGLKARKLASDERILCASPAYLERNGTPDTPQDLSQHQLLGFAGNNTRKLSLADGIGEASFPPANTVPRLIFDDGGSMRMATLAGAGISMNARWLVYNDMAEERLVHVLPDYTIHDDAALWLVYPKSNVLTPKVRALIDFLLEKIGAHPVWEQIR